MERICYCNHAGKSPCTFICDGHDCVFDSCLVFYASGTAKIQDIRTFMWIYNIGLPITAVMMVIRGITQVLNISLSTAANAAISGIAGIGHILTGVGIILLLVSLKKAAENGR